MRDCNWSNYNSFNEICVSDHHEKFICYTPSNSIGIINNYNPFINSCNMINPNYPIYANYNIFQNTNPQNSYYSPGLDGQYIYTQDDYPWEKYLEENEIKIKLGIPICIPIPLPVPALILACVKLEAKDPVKFSVWITVDKVKVTQGYLDITNKEADVKVGPEFQTKLFDKIKLDFGITGEFKLNTESMCVSACLNLRATAFGIGLKTAPWYTLISCKDILAPPIP